MMKQKFNFLQSRTTENQVIDAGRRPGIQTIVDELRAKNPSLSLRAACIRAKHIWIERNRHGGKRDR